MTISEKKAEQINTETVSDHEVEPATLPLTIHQASKKRSAASSTVTTFKDSIKDEHMVEVEEGDYLTASPVIASKRNSAHFSTS